MVEGNQPMQAWPTHGLQAMERVIIEARDANKMLFIWDKQGSVATYLNYKGFLASLGPEIIKKALGRQENADVGEFIRVQMINGMRSGDKLCWDLDSTTPKWSDYAVEGTFNPEHFFNWEFMKVEANYMPYVREDENHGIGGVNPGFGYIRSPDFSMTFRCGAETEEEVAAVIALLPNFNTDFHHVIIE